MACFTWNDGTSGKSQAQLAKWFRVRYWIVPSYKEKGQKREVWINDVKPNAYDSVSMKTKWMSPKDRYTVKIRIQGYKIEDENIGLVAEKKECSGSEDFKG